MRNDLGHVEQFLHGIYAELYSTFCEKADIVPTLHTHIQHVLNIFRETLLAVSLTLDQLVQKPLPEKPKKKGKKTAKASKKHLDDSHQDASPENENPPPLPLWQKLETLGYSKRQVKEIFFYSLKQLVLSASPDAISHEDPSSVEQDSTFIATQVQKRRQYLSSLQRKYQHSHLSFESNLARAQHLEQSIDRAILSQLSIKEKQIQFVQYWIHMNMNMKGSLLQPTEQLTAQNFMKLAGVNLFPEVEGYDQTHQQQATLIQNAIRSSLARRRTESMRAASNKTIHKEVELNVDEHELESEQEQDSSQSSDESSSIDQVNHEDLSFYEEQLQTVLEQVLTQVNASWHEEQGERQRLFEDFAMDSDIVDEPEGWSGQSINLQKSVREVLEVLQTHLPEGFASPEHTLVAVASQTKEYQKKVDTCLKEFLHSFGSQKIRQLFQFHCRESDREQVFGD